jgi:hypothetical protein
MPNRSADNGNSDPPDDNNLQLKKILTPFENGRDWIFVVGKNLLPN